MPCSSEMARIYDGNRRRDEELDLVTSLLCYVCGQIEAWREDIEETPAYLFLASLDEVSLWDWYERHKKFDEASVRAGRSQDKRGVQG